MSPEEAIGALKLINLKGVHPFYDWEEMREVRDTAIKALEKQTPKKPTPHKVDIPKLKIGNGFWGKNTTVYICPCCGEYISRTYKCCYTCGQKIDWSDAG